MHRGDDTEILCYLEERGENFARDILPEIVELGFRNVGVKYRENLYALNKTKMSAILFECAFVIVKLI